MAKICMGCMNPLPDGDETCRICGFSRNDQNPSQCLRVATVLQEHYIVGRAMSESSDSLVYIGYDRLLKEPCFVQEFYPSTLCERGENGAVVAIGGCERPFGEYREAFRTQMRSVAKVKELPTMIPVYDIFEENGTVYAVSDYCQGVTLTRKIKQAGGRLPWSEARPLFMSLMTCVAQLHKAGIRHLAICPDNILICADGKPHLRNFSIAAARRAGGDLKPELVPGFAAPEQYMMDTPVGNEADVYGLAATVFYTVTGNVPPVGNRRAKNSDDLFMAAEVAEELTQPVCLALFNALQVDPQQRTGSVAVLHDQLSTEPNVSALRDEVVEEQEMEESLDKKEHKSHAVLIVFLTVLVALIAIGAVLLSLWLGGAGTEPQESEPSAVLPTITAKKTTEKKEKQYAVDNLVGKSYYDVRDTDLTGDMTITVIYQQYSDKPAGTILSQDPEAGKGMPKETNINVIISCGRSDELAIPDISGWPQEYAKLYLEALGFRTETVLLQASDYERGQVDSTDPPIGTIKRIGDTITLRISDVEPPIIQDEDIWDND